MRRSRIITVSATACAIGALTAAWSLSSRPVEESGHITLVRRAGLELRVEAAGVLDARRATTFVSAMRGDKGKLLHLAEDGARVQPGDVLAKFDTTDIESEVQRLGGELRSRQAVNSYAGQALEVEKSQVEKALTHSATAAASARQEFARYAAYIDDLDALARRGIPVASELAQARRKADQVRTKLEGAEGEVDRVKREGVHRLAQSMAELNKAASEAANILHSLELLQTQIENSVLRAPAPGFVVVHETTVGEQKRRLRVGDTVWQGQPILYLPDLSSMIVRSKVREEDLHKIREGQAATVRVEAYPDAVFQGAVTGIGALALDSGGATAGKFFQMTVSLDGRDERLRPGMTARVSIVADRADNVLVVPIPAVFYAGEHAHCFVIGEKGATARHVRLGRRGDDVVEVIAGLAEGERISLAKP